MSCMALRMGDFSHATLPSRNTNRIGRRDGSDCVNFHLSSHFFGRVSEDNS
jgi:hypothetical protein